MTIKELLSSTKAFWTALLFISGMITIGWNARVASEALPQKVTRMELRQDRDSTRIDDVRQEVRVINESYVKHAEQLESNIRQTNRVLCAILYPNAGAQRDCERRENSAAGVTQ